MTTSLLNYYKELNTKESELEIKKHAASSLGLIDKVSALLDSGANQDILGEQGYTALLCM